MKHKNQKNKLIRIWEILRQDTDAAHTLSTNALVERLADEGIVVERKTIYNDIKLLQDMGYPVYVRRTRVNEYYAEDSSFSVAELRILIDSVQAASFLSARKAKELANKVALLAGANRGEALRGTTTFFSEAARPDDEVWNAVGTLQQAIADRRRITFRYYHYDMYKNRRYQTRSDGTDVYALSPYNLLYKDNNYYLVGILEGKDNYSTYRVDRMVDVVVGDEKRATPDWTKTYAVSTYCNETFGMYAGTGVRATFLCSDERAVGIVLGRFGYDTKLVPIDDTHYYFTANVQLSPQFYSWLVGLDNLIRLYSPAEAVEAYSRFLQAQLAAVQALADK